MFAGALLMAGVAPSTHAADPFITGQNLQKMADAILSLMGYSLTPDVTTGSLSISSDPTANPNIYTTSIGGGITVSSDFPLYLEGTTGVSHYDPVFLVSNGEEQREVSTLWKSISGTVGVGWDFRLTDAWKLRPIGNLSLGRVESDGSLVGFALEELTGEQIEFLNGGTRDAYGLGGTLMLDYERYRPANEMDVEIRFTDIRLQSRSDSPTSIQGNSNCASLSIWTRWRAPTGAVMMDRPLRYVLEAAQTRFLADLKGQLGFDVLSSLGVGVELDSGAHNIIISRTRLVVRYQFGNNVEGSSVGLAVSF